MINFLKKNRKQGFTLIELVVVIAIMAILALIMVPNLTAYIKKADASKIEANMKNIHTAAEMVRQTEKELKVEDIKNFSNIDNIEKSEVPIEITYKVFENGNKQVVVQYKDKKDEVHTFYPELEGGTGSENPTEPEIQENPADWYTYSDQTITGFDQIYINQNLGGVQPKNLVLPSKNPENNQPITVIGEASFVGKQLTSVIIPNTVETIGKNSFQNNQLTEVVIPNFVTTIGEHAFFGNQLTSLTIGNSVTNIKMNAFQGNQLTSVAFPDSLTEIGMSAFAGNKLAGELVISNSVTKIGQDAFTGNPGGTIYANLLTGDQDFGTGFRLRGCMFYSLSWTRSDLENYTP